MIEITPILYGKSVLSEDAIFYDGSNDKVLPIVFMIYLVKTENHIILVDAGCETMPGFEMQDFVGTLTALKMAGVAPEDVTDVIITHAHHDHIECVKYFKNAVIHIEQDEYENGKKYIPNDFKTNIFQDKYKICNDIEVIKIGGHSKGSCVVEIKKDDKIFVIAGDECYSRQCFVEQRHTGSFFDETASKEFVQKYSADPYKILLCHEL